ncbi:MAG: trigger factor [Syntrophales bacterium]|nr:trigger factor [Syntrophales bacterium]
MEEINVKVEEVSPVEKKLLFDIPWSDVKKELDFVYKDVGRKAKIKGFRPGKTPRKTLEVYYKDQAESQTISNLVNRFYGEILKKNDIVPVSEPVIDDSGIEKDKNFTFSATVEVEPVIEPKDYVGLELEKEEIEITDKDIQVRLEELRNMYSTLDDIDSDRGIIQGDFTYIDFEGKLDGKPIKDLAQKNYLLEMGSKRFLLGFEEQLLGLKKGETKEIVVKIPDDYFSKKIAGKDVSFSVTVINIKKKILPELDENFVKNFEKYESLDELKEDIKKSLEEENEVRVDAELRGRIIDKLLEKNEFQVPPSFVGKQVFSMMMDTHRRMVLGGMDSEKAAEVSSNLHDKFKGDAEKMVKTALLFNSIAKKESITVDEEDIEKKLKDFAGKYAQDYESLKKSYEEGNRMESFKMKVFEEKMLDFIKEKSKINLAKKTEEK